MKASVLTLAALAAGVAMAKPAVVRELIAQPNTAKGFAAVVNRQKLVPEKEFAEALVAFRVRRNYVFDFARKDGATVTISIVDEPGKPPMTVSPEAGIGCLNVAALTNDLKTAESMEKFFVSRARKEFLRTVAFAFGVGSSQFKNNIFTAFSLHELDFMKEMMPVDVIDKLDRSAKSRGMQPERIVDYSVACGEGWAPAPTNAVQKAIWDEIHALPTAPIKIKPETKKVSN